MFIAGKGGWRNKQPGTLLQGPQPHQHFYNADLIMAECTSKYYEYFAFLGENVKVFPCGLVVNVNNRWLGCSPDAKLMFHNKIGIGESKCPYEHRDSDLMDVARSNKNFYLQVVGGNLHFKT